jgi:hypothetical protein
MQLPTHFTSGREIQRHHHGFCSRRKVVSGHAQLNLVDIADVQGVETFEAPELATFGATPREANGTQGSPPKMPPQTACIAGQ